MPGTLPRTVGRYELRRELGRGTMGVVYEAVDRDLGRLVALKTIQLAFVPSEGEREVFQQRFLAEARIAARLSHPGIVAVRDVGRDPATGTLYIALEYLQGRTLAEIISAGGLAWRDALRITGRVAEALHHAHTHGVIHRDVKPGNIMVLSSGEPKLMDFGIAKTETARIKLTATGQFFGTPLYMAPEQALGRPVDGRADLFSLGSILYALLTGRNAFAAENITKIITRVVQEDPPPPSHRVPALPEDVDYVVARTLAKDPAHRYPDGKSLAEDVEDVLAACPPRHAAGWTHPGAPATLVSVPEGEEADLDLERLLVEPYRPRMESDLPTLDLEAQLATLVPPLAGERGAPAGPDRPRAPATTTTGADRAQAGRGRAVRARQPDTVRARRLGQRAELWIVGLSVVLVAALLAALSRRADTEGPVGAARGALPAQPAGGSVLPQVMPGRLAIAFEHSVKSGGLLRIWVDRQLVVEQRFDGRTRTITAFGFRKGDVQEFLDLPPGGHDVEVRVAWDGGEKTERIWGDFTAGGTRRLRARIGGLFKGLSLEWQ